MTFLGIPNKYLLLAIAIGIVISVVISMIFGMILTYTPTTPIHQIEIVPTPAASVQPHDNFNTSYDNFNTSYSYMGELYTNYTLLALIIMVIGFLFIMGRSAMSMFLFMGIIITINFFPISSEYTHFIFLAISLYFMWVLYNILRN